MFSSLNPTSLKILAGIQKDALLRTRMKTEREHKKKDLREADPIPQKAKIDFTKATANYEMATANCEPIIGTSDLLVELHHEYEAFCYSLCPLEHYYGCRIMRYTKHGGCYPTHDPTFGVLKEAIETPYNEGNWRSEVSTYMNLADFFPITRPQPVTGTETCLGERFVSCPKFNARTYADNVNNLSQNFTILPWN